MVILFTSFSASFADDFDFDFDFETLLGCISLFDLLFIEDTLDCMAFMYLLLDDALELELDCISLLVDLLLIEATLEAFDLWEPADDLSRTRILSDVSCCEKKSINNFKNK